MPLSMICSARGMLNWWTLPAALPLQPRMLRAGAVSRSLAGPRRAAGALSGVSLSAAPRGASRPSARIAVAANVHVHHARRLAAAGGCAAPSAPHRPAAAPHHRAHLVLGEHQVAHDHGLATHRLEGDPGAQRQGRLDRHPRAVTCRSVRGRLNLYDVAAGCIAPVLPAPARRPASRSAPARRPRDGSARERTPRRPYTPPA